MSERDDFGTFIAGFFIGGLVGASIALLYAPQSGEETRIIIRDKSIELKDKAVESVEEARVRAEKALDNARDKAEAAIEEARVQADELAKITRQRASELGQRGQVVLEKQKSKVSEAIEAGKKVARRVRGETGTEEASDSGSPLEV